MMSAREKATILGELARLIWEAYPHESIEVGTTPSPVSHSICRGREMTIRVRCWVEDGRYFAMDLAVEDGATTLECLFDEAKDAILDGTGWGAL